MKYSKILKLVSEWMDERLSVYEEKRKYGKKRRLIQPPLCPTTRHCHIVFEYRPDSMVYLRCKKCMRVYKKRPMDHRERTDYHDRVIQSIIDTQGTRKERSSEMVNDGSKFLTPKERAAHVSYCEDMIQYYREDVKVQFHLLDDFELLEYVDCYKFDQSLECILDKPVSK